MEPDAALHACPVRPLKYISPCPSIYNLAPGSERLCAVRIVESTRTVQEIVLRVSVALLPRYPFRALICHDFQECQNAPYSTCHLATPLSPGMAGGSLAVMYWRHICTRSFCH
jgi:hypothetical protein